MRAVRIPLDQNRSLAVKVTPAGAHVQRIFLRGAIILHELDQRTGPQNAVDQQVVGVFRPAHGASPSAVSHTSQCCGACSMSCSMANTEIGGIASAISASTPPGAIGIAGIPGTGAPPSKIGTLQKI